MDRLPDELLVAHSLDGDHRSFEMLVERYQTLVCSIAYSITGDFARSEDVGQESLVEAWKQLDRLTDIPPLPIPLPQEFGRRQIPSTDRIFRILGAEGTTNAQLQKA